MTSGGPPSEETRIIRRQPEAPLPAPPAEPRTGIIRRQPTGPFPTSSGGTPSPLRPAPPPSTSPLAASSTATVSITSGWAIGIIATSLVTEWWRTDELFSIAIGFLTAVSAAATIGGLVSLLLRHRIGRLLIVVGAVVALMIFAGLMVAGTELPRIVYAIPALPVASIVLALLPATGRWCR